MADLGRSPGRPQGAADPRPVRAAGRRRPAVRAGGRRAPRPASPSTAGTRCWNGPAPAGPPSGRCCRTWPPSATDRRRVDPAAAVRGDHHAVGAGERDRSAGGDHGGHPLGRRVDPAPAALPGPGADRRAGDDHRQLPHRRADPAPSAAALPGRDRPADRHRTGRGAAISTGPRSPSCSPAARSAAEQRGDRHGLPPQRGHSLLRRGADPLGRARLHRHARHAARRVERPHPDAVRRGAADRRSSRRSPATGSITSCWRRWPAAPASTSIAGCGRRSTRPC